MIRFESRPSDNSVSRTLGRTVLISLVSETNTRGLGEGVSSPREGAEKRLVVGRERGDGGSEPKELEKGVVKEAGGQTMDRGAKESALGGAPKTTAASVLDSAGFLAPD